MDTLWLCMVSNQSPPSNHCHGDVSLSDAPPSNHCHGDVCVDDLVSVLVGPLPEDRHALVRKVSSTRCVRLVTSQSVSNGVLGRKIRPGEDCV